MNRNSQRSLNAGWTRRQNTRPAPQVRPVSILTRAGDVVTGVCWLQGRPTSYTDLMDAFRRVVATYKATGDTSGVYQQVLIQVQPGTPCTVLRFIDLKQVTPIG
jgi:hypothetical protein